MIKKKTKKKSITNTKLDKLWAVATKKRAGGRCEKCGSVTTLNSHHIFGRVCKSVRWNMSNCCVLCSKCHYFSTEFSAHQTPLLFSDWIRAKRGEEWFDELATLANTPKKWTKEDKEEMLNEFKQCLGEI
jgi:hypothetical protein